jgi:hypothetical protein
MQTNATRSHNDVPIQPIGVNHVWMFVYIHAVYLRAYAAQSFVSECYPY